MKRKYLKNERGFSLLSIVIAMGLLTSLLAATQSLVTVGFRSSSSNDLRYSVTALASTLKDRVSCARTLQGVDIARDCNPASPKALTLKDGAGTALTEALFQPGIFNPLDETLRGSAKLGAFQVRAYCDNQQKTLVIRFARPQGDEFLRDPISRRPMDWQNSSVNPLFGAADRTLCSSHLGGGGDGGLGLINSKTVFKRVLTPIGALTGVNVDAPAGARLVKIVAKGQNLATYGGGSASSEDSADFQMVVDLDRATSTGYYSVVGGSGAANTVLFSWEDKPFDQPFGVEGDRLAWGPQGQLLASTFRPQFDFDPEAGRFRIERLALYSPAQYVFLFEFYGK